MCLRGVIRVRGEIRLRLMCLRNVSSRLRSRTRPDRNVSSKCVFVCGRKSACTSAHTMALWEWLYCPKQSLLGGFPMLHASALTSSRTVQKWCAAHYLNASNPFKCFNLIALPSAWQAAYCTGQLPPRFQSPSREGPGFGQTGMESGQPRYRTEDKIKLQLAISCHHTVLPIAIHCMDCLDCLWVVSSPFESQWTLHVEMLLLPFSPAFCSQSWRHLKASQGTCQNYSKVCSAVT